jgi:hypothetical protein
VEPRILHRPRRPASIRRPVAIALLAAGASLAGCGEGADAGPPSPPQVSLLDSPAPEGSGEPNLSVDAEGRVHLTWFERLPGGEDHALRFAVLDPGSGSWSLPRTIVKGLDFFVNWADFPSLLPLPGGDLVAHWLQRSGPGTFHYDVVLSRSGDGGATWSEGFRPHRDGTLSEHGFVSLVPWEAPDGGDGVAAVWLDGRKYESQPDNPEMTLRFTTLGSGSGAAALGPEVLLDDRVCDCCQTSAARTDQGLVVVYRDRSPDEVRDISVIRLEDGTWTEPAPVHEDGWTIPACPVNGPMVAAAGQDVAVAWFTAAQDRPRVHLAFSRDGGRSFSAPVRVDDGDPAGRVALVLLDPSVPGEGGDALVSWLERVDGRAEVRVRRITPAGARSPARTVAVSTEARASGFPRMARTRDHLVFAWTEPAPEAGGDSRVRVATAPLEVTP